LEYKSTFLKAVILKLPSHSEFTEIRQHYRWTLPEASKERISLEI